MTMRTLFMLTLALTLGCSAAGANAVVSTAIGVGVAGARRANGECYTPCTPGNTCNPQSGLCEPLPCRGECQLNEACELTPTGEKCVPAAAAVPLELRTSSSTFKAGSPADAGVVSPTLPPSERLIPR